MSEKKNESFSLIHSIPDLDTMELCIYGNSYTTVKEAIYRIDHMESILCEQRDELLIRLIQRDDYQELVFKLGPDHFRKIEPDENPMLADLQRYLKTMAALEWCEKSRTSVTLYGRIIGAAERGRTLAFSDNIGEIWSRSVQELCKTPIEFRRTNG